MDARTAIDLPIDIDERRVRSETLQATLSPYVVTIGTTLPAHGVSLYSTYHGHPRTESVAVHLIRVPLSDPRSEICRHAETAMPVVFARARCLRDHALRLLDLLGSAGLTGAVHVTDEAELAVEAARGAVAP